MRIQYERAGGFAAPAMRRSYSVDTAQLPAHEASELETLVKSADLGAAADDAGETKARDQFHYRLTVEDDGRTHSVEATDSGMPARLRPLVDWLHRHSEGK